jgi:hypothetical protein
VWFLRCFPSRFLRWVSILTLVQAWANWTKVNGEDAFDALEKEWGSVGDMVLDIGFKIGCGPFGNAPSYLALAMRRNRPSNL